MAIVSIAEDFIVSTLLERVQDDLAGQHRINADATRTMVAEVDRNWPTRRRLAKRWYGIDFSASVCMSELLIFVEARNAILHGAGRLTRRQMSDDAGASISAAFTSVDLRVDANRSVVADDAAVKRSAVAGQRSIGWFDEQLASAELTPSEPSSTNDES